MHETNLEKFRKNIILDYAEYVNNNVVTFSGITETIKKSCLSRYTSDHLCILINEKMNPTLPTHELKLCHKLDALRWILSLVLSDYIKLDYDKIGGLIIVCYDGRVFKDVSELYLTEFRNKKRTYSVDFVCDILSIFFTDSYDPVRYREPVRRYFEHFLNPLSTNLINEKYKLQYWVLKNKVIKFTPTGCEVLDHSPQYMARDVIDIDYDPKDNNLTLYHNLLDARMSRKEQECLEMSCIFPYSGNRARLFTLMQGVTATGKSVFEKIISNVLPNVTTNVDYDGLFGLKSKMGLTAGGIAKYLVGKVLSISSDSFGSIEDYDMFKRLAEGLTIEFNTKASKDGLYLEVPPANIGSINKSFNFSRYDSAIKDRINIIEFAGQSTPEKDRELGLPDKIIRNCGSALVNLFIERYNKLSENNFDYNLLINKATQDYKHEFDPADNPVGALLQFLMTDNSFCEYCHILKGMRYSQFQALYKMCTTALGLLPIRGTKELTALINKHFEESPKKLRDFKGRASSGQMIGIKYREGLNTEHLFDYLLKL